LLFAAALRRATRDERVLWLAAGLGVAASAPFVFGDTGLRALAAAYPALALAAARGLALGDPQPTSTPASVTPLLGAGAAILTLMLVGPAVTRSGGPPDALRAAVAPDELLVEPDRCTGVLLSGREIEDVALGRVSSADLERLAQAAAYAADDLETLRQPLVLLSCLDHASQRLRVVAARHQLLRAPTRDGWLKLRVEPLAESAELLAAADWPPAR
jgi:hypothetical protein